VEAVGAASGGKLYRRRSDVTKCLETTTAASSKVDLTAIGLTANALKTERKLQVKSTADSGRANYLALTRTLGTSTFESLCLSWQYNNISKGREQCLTNVELQDSSRAFVLDFADIPCVKGDWKLSFEPKGEFVTPRKHNFFVPVTIECTFVYRGQPATQVNELVKGNPDGGSDNNQWQMSVVVGGLGYDIDELGSDLKLAADLSCAVWGSSTNKVIPAQPIRSVLTNPDGSAELTLEFEEIPVAKRLNGDEGCSLFIKATPPGASQVIGKSLVNLSSLGAAVAEKVESFVREIVVENLKSATFDRQFEGSKYSTIVKFNAVACPVGDFSVELVLTNESDSTNTVVKPCDAAGTNISWTALSVGSNDSSSSLSNASLKITISGLGSYTKTSSIDLRGLCMSNEFNSPCDDPRIPIVTVSHTVTLDENQSLNVRLKISDLVKFSKATLSDANSCSELPNSDDFNFTFNPNSWPTGTELQLQFGITINNVVLKSSRLIGVTVP
jgi:hypothetical protein